MKSQVVALCEDGLILDVFADQPKIFSANIYKIKENILLKGTETRLSVLDLKNNTIIMCEEVGRIKKLDFGENIFGYLLHEKKASIYIKIKEENSLHYKQIFSISNAHNLKICDKTVLIRINRECHVFCVENDVCVKKMVIPSVTKFFIDKSVFVIFSGHVLSIYKNYSKVIDFTLAQVDSVEVKISPQNNFVLCCATSTICGGSYFGFKELFLFHLLTNKSKKLDIQSPHFFEFIKSGYSVCYGQQPAIVTNFDYKGKITKRFSNGVKNRIYYNIHQNIVCFAGFDNLNGMIEIYDAQTSKIISSMKMLGASQVYWSPCGSYFAVAITNALKVDNKIVIYDFFGRKIKERHFSNLIACEWIGEKEKFQMLDKPKELIIYQEGSYVPPSFEDSSVQKRK